MKLIDRLLKGECPAYGTLLNEEMWHELPVVLANESAELYWRLSAQDKSPTFKNDMGPLLPPWPMWWTEWVIPQDIPFTKSGARISDFGSDAVGAQAGVLSIAMELEVGWHIEMTPFLGNRHNVVHMPLSYEVLMDREGNWAGKVDADGYPQIDTRVLSDDIKVYEQQGHMALHAVKLAASTVGLINCKNVTLMDASSSMEMTKARQRRSGFKPIERWSIVRLPAPARRTNDRREAKAALGDDLPAHVVRGHFQTYSEDHKLFGKHVGTWWWGSFVKGSPENGKIKRIVEVGVE